MISLKTNSNDGKVQMNISPGTSWTDAELIKA